MPVNSRADLERLIYALFELLHKGYEKARLSAYERKLVANYRKETLTEPTEATE